MNNLQSDSLLEQSPQRSPSQDRRFYGTSVSPPRGGQEHQQTVTIHDTIWTTGVGSKDSPPSLNNIELSTSTTEAVDGSSMSRSFAAINHGVSGSKTFPAENRSHSYRKVSTLQRSTTLPSFQHFTSALNEQYRTVEYRDGQHVPSEDNDIPEDLLRQAVSPGYNKFTCNTCQKKFNNKNSLSKHKQIHGERGNVCTICSAKFHTKKDLNRHHDTIHAKDSNQYLCPITSCPRSKKGFSRKDNLRQHVTGIHGEEYLEKIRSIPISTDTGASQATTDDAGTSQFPFFPIEDERNSISPSRSLGQGESVLPASKGKGRLIDFDENPSNASSNHANSDVEMQDTRDDKSEISRQSSIGGTDIGNNARMESQPQETIQIDPKIENQNLQNEKTKSVVSVSETQSHREERDPLIPDSSITRDILNVTQQNANLLRMDLDTTKDISSVQNEASVTKVSAKPTVSGDTSDNWDMDWVQNLMEGFTAEEIREFEKMKIQDMKRKPKLQNYSEDKLKLFKGIVLGLFFGLKRLPGSGAININTEKLAKLSIGDSKSPSTVRPRSLSRPDVGISGLPGNRELQPITTDDALFVKPNTDISRNASKPKLTEHLLLNIIIDSPRQSPQTTYKCKEPGCTKIFTKASEFKKHTQRHLRPYFCTFHWQELSEVKSFGSKDDWRRHEEHAHYQQEFYKCPGGLEPICRTSFPDKEKFGDHLKLFHWTSVGKFYIPGQEEERDNFFKSCHNGTDHVEDGFWCGFCARLIPIPKALIGRKGKEARANHIADHFHKQGEHIRLWVKYNECNLASNKVDIDNARTKYFRQKEEGTLDNDEAEALDTRELPSLAHVLSGSNETRYKPIETSKPRQYPGDDMEISQPSTQVVERQNFNIFQERPATGHWFCCQCEADGALDYSWNPLHEQSCARHDHQRCDRCTIYDR